MLWTLYQQASNNNTEAGQPDDKTGVVEFVAIYQEDRRIGQLRERSRFLKQRDRWFYLEGDLLPPLQPKCNDPCWCGSGKKFKQCHGKKYHGQKSHGKKS